MRLPTCLGGVSYLLECAIASSDTAQWALMSVVRDSAYSNEGAEMIARQTWDLIKESVSAWQNDQAASMGAALSYYSAFSLGPVLLIAVALAGLMFGQEAAQKEILIQVEWLVGQEGARAVGAMLGNLWAPGPSFVATGIGVLTLLVGATSVFAELQADMDRIWQAPAPTGSGVWHLLRTRLLSFGVILALTFLMLVSLLVSAGLAVIGQWWGAGFRGEKMVLEMINFAASLAVVTALFAVIYKVLPRVQVAWRDVWIGATVTSVLFVIGKLLIGIYLGRSGIVSGFGAAGSFMVIMVWVYYSAQLFLLGAEFTWVYAHRYGSRRGLDHPAVEAQR